MRLLLMALMLAWVCGCRESSRTTFTFEAIVFKWPKVEAGALVCPPDESTYEALLKNDRVWRDYIAPRLSFTGDPQIRDRVFIVKNVTRRVGDELLLEMSLRTPNEAVFDGVRDGLFAFLHDFYAIGRSKATVLLSQELEKTTDLDRIKQLRARIAVHESEADDVRLLVAKK